MKVKNKLAAAALLSVISLSAIADAGKTHVDIAIDSEFKDKNIVFTVDMPNFTSETVGFYQAGDPLAIHADVEPIVDEQGNAIPAVITAYVSETSARTSAYESKNTYQFSSDTSIGLSFPIMFMPS